MYNYAVNDDSSDDAGGKSLSLAQEKGEKPNKQKTNTELGNFWLGKRILSVKI